jgi:Holliday junction resolvasome RuvABC endonuclease subunit
MILSLDVATKCGWALGDLTAIEASGVWDFSVKKDESSGMRLVRFKTKLHELFSTRKIEMVTFERSAGMHKAPIIVQSELHGVLKIVCEDLGIKYKAYSATEVKKFATDKGNANKDAMRGALSAKHNILKLDDNEIDAIWILKLTQKDFEYGI